MYSSYADLISFDPETGIAKFDYFDMLRGADAVKFLSAGRCVGRSGKQRL